MVKMCILFTDKPKFNKIKAIVRDLINIDTFAI